MLLCKIIFDRFDTSSAQSDVSFERLISILKNGFDKKFWSFWEHKREPKQSSEDNQGTDWYMSELSYYIFILSLMCPFDE